MHWDLILLKHKNPNRSQQSPPDSFSQVNWFFPALWAWKHLPAVRKAPPSKTINLAPLFPGRWPRTSYLCLNSLGARLCNVTQRETHLRSSSSKKTQLPPLPARERRWQSTPALASPPAPCQEPTHTGTDSWGRHSCWGLKGAKSEPLFTKQHCWSTMKAHSTASACSTSIPNWKSIPSSTAFSFQVASPPWDYSIFPLPLCLKKWGISAVK